MHEKYKSWQQREFIVKQNPSHFKVHFKRIYTISPFTCVVGGGPDERVGWGAHGLEFHPSCDDVIGTNSQHLLSSHQDAVGMFGWVKEDLDVTGAALLPLAEGPVPTIEPGAFLEKDFLILLSGLCLHLGDKMRCASFSNSKWLKSTPI